MSTGRYLVVYKATRLVNDEKAVNCHRRHSDRRSRRENSKFLVSAAEENIRNDSNLHTCKRGNY
jgi:hypothetical protein